MVALRTVLFAALFGAVLTSVGGAAAASPPALWESYARPVAPYVARPAAERALCSFDEPLCIHAVDGTPKSAVLHALDAAESAMHMFRALGLPSPMSDGGRGGSAALDLYLSPHHGSRAYADAIPSTIGFDRAAAFATVVPHRPGPGCTFDSDIARVVAQAMLLAIDGAVHDGVLAAHSSWLAEAAAPCAPLALDALDRAQQRPDLALASGSPEELSGMMLFPWFLDDAYGTGRLGGVMTALIATSCQLTPSGERFYDNEPDVFDALRKVTLDRQMSLGEMLVELAIARAFMGDRSDGLHLLDVGWLGALGRVRFEWAVAWADLPKRVAPAYPLEPTGAGYVFLDLSGKPDDAELTIVADWEATHVFQWAAVRLDAEGRELGRHLFGGTFGEAQAQLSLRDLTGVSSLIVVGTHLGNDDRSKAYDPERGEPRAAGYTVTFHAQ